MFLFVVFHLNAMQISELKDEQRGVVDELTEIGG